MSHIVTVQTRLYDPVAIAAACARLQLAAPVHGKVELFSGEAVGLLVQLPGWRYPIVIDTPTGNAQFDNYEGQWGERQHLDKFLQIYAVEKTRLEARKQGYSITEQVLEDGGIKLQIIETV